MRNFIKATLAIAVIMLFIACGKDDKQSVEQYNREKVSVNIDGVINNYAPEDETETKVSAQAVIRILWQGGETVYAYQGDRYLGALQANAQLDGSIASLKGELDSPQEGKVITFICSPQFTEQPEIWNSTLYMDIADQTEKDLPFIIYATHLYTSGDEITGIVVYFDIATSFYKCNCADLPLGPITKAQINEINTVLEMTFSDSAAPVITGSAPGIITRKNGFTSANNDQRAIFSISVAPSPAVSSRTLEVTKGGKIYNANFDNREIGAGKSINAVFMCTPKN